jgi:phosphatidylserine decarboxylase
MIRTDSPRDRLLVRQISGAIARRIVCATSESEELSGGQRFGMIKFGSRTELYVPISSYVLSDENCAKDSSVKYEIKCLVKKGDKVYAGMTPLIEYIERNAENAEIKN